MSSPDPLPDLPPGASPFAARAARALMRPVDRFLEREAAGSVLLLVASSAALVWANSPWAASYRALWDTPIHVGAAGRTVDVTLHVLINDLLMAVFFGQQKRRGAHIPARSLRHHRRREQVEGQAAGDAERVKTDGRATTEETDGRPSLRD